MKIRPEISDDSQLVRELHLISFPNADEADLVDQLHANGDAIISLVARSGNEVVGHVMYSRMNAPFKALGLAPVAVHPDYRRQGIADRLIRNGIEQAKLSEWEGMFVLGEPAYYQRFGFSAAHAEKFQSPYAGPYLMALGLQGSALPTLFGKIEYASAFTKLG